MEYALYLNDAASIALKLHRFCSQTPEPKWQKHLFPNFSISIIKIKLSSQSIQCIKFNYYSLN